MIFFLTLTKTLLRVLLQVSNSKTCSSLTASAIRLPNTLRQSLINFALNRCATHTCFFADFYIATTPSLRDASPQGEAFKRLPLMGAVNAVDCGVASLFFRLSRSTGDQWSPLHIFFILSKIRHI